MRFTESEVKDAALAWLEGLGRAIKQKFEGVPSEPRVADAEWFIVRAI